MSENWAFFRNIVILLIFLAVLLFLFFNSIFYLSLFSDKTNITHFIENELNSKLFSIKYPFGIEN